MSWFKRVLRDKRPDKGCYVNRTDVFYAHPVCCGFAGFLLVGFKGIIRIAIITGRRPGFPSNRCEPLPETAPPGAVGCAFFFKGRHAVESFL